MGLAIFVTLIVGMGFVVGLIVGSMGLYLFLFAKGVREYTKRKKEHNKFAADLKQELEKSKADIIVSPKDFNVSYRAPHV